MWFDKATGKASEQPQSRVYFDNNTDFSEGNQISPKQKQPGEISVISGVTNSSGENSYLDDGDYDCKIDVFRDPEVAEYWRQKYEECGYENRHLFDPELTWTKKEEQRIVRISDIRALFWAFIMFLALDIDRYNLKNAVSDNLLKDVGLTKADYNLGNTLNLVFFLAAELPSQLVSKAVGANRFLPTQVILWSLVATCQCKMNSRGSFLATRCLVGFLEGGFLPEIITWLSYFFTHSEFTTRSAWFYIANPLTQAFSGLLAAAITNLRGRGGWAGWQYVFLIEGLFTLTLGILSYHMPAGPATTKSWWSRKGWFTEREEKIMANRILRDDPSKGTMNFRESISLKMLLRALSDYDMWPLYISRFLIDIITTPISQYMPIILRGLKFTSVQTNLLMVPYNIVQIGTMLTQSHLAQRFHQNGFALFFSPFWNLATVACMRWWPSFLIDQWGSYGLLFVALAFPPSWPVSISWSSSNSYSVARRTVSAAIMNIFSQAGSIVGSNVFQPDDAPRYPRGLEALFAIVILASAFVLFTRYWYAWRNSRREAIWSKMSVEEQIEYIKTTKDEGNKRLDFRFRL